MASSSPVLQLPARVEALSGLSAIPLEYVRPADERASLGDAFDLARTHANDHTAPRIPVVDISPFLTDTSSQQQRDVCVEAVRAAAADWGVMHIAGHGIPAELMDRLHAAGAAFFALPIQDKEAYCNYPWPPAITDDVRGDRIQRSAKKRARLTPAPWLHEFVF